MQTPPSLTLGERDGLVRVLHGAVELLAMRRDVGGFARHGKRRWPISWRGIANGTFAGAGKVMSLRGDFMLGQAPCAGEASISADGFSISIPLERLDAVAELRLDMVSGRPEWHGSCELPDPLRISEGTETILWWWFDVVIPPTGHQIDVAIRGVVGKRTLVAARSAPAGEGLERAILGARQTAIDALRSQLLDELAELESQYGEIEFSPTGHAFGALGSGAEGTEHASGAAQHSGMHRSDTATEATIGTFGVSGAPGAYLPVATQIGGAYLPVPRATHMALHASPTQVTQGGTFLPVDARLAGAASAAVSSGSYLPGAYLPGALPAASDAPAGADAVEGGDFAAAAAMHIMAQSARQALSKAESLAVSMYECHALRQALFTLSDTTVEPTSHIEA